MTELMTNPPAGMSPRRIEAERNRIHMHIVNILTPSVRKFVRRKNMTATDRLDIDQHVSIAIVRAIETWDSGKATFSTHVHWKIMAELQALQWKEYPDRRRLVIEQPIRMVEIDRPLRRMDDDSCDMTLLDTLRDEQDEERAEEGAATYMAHHRFEKVLSHYVMRQLGAKQALGEGARAAGDRRKVMRDYDIYRTRVLLLGSLEMLAAHNGVTRERIRQIVNKVNDGIKGQLPVIRNMDGAREQDEERHVVVEATRPIPSEIHDGWTDLLARHLAETGEDVSIEAPAVQRVRKVEEIVLDTVTTEIVETVVLDRDDADADAGDDAVHAMSDAVEEETTILLGNIVPFRSRSLRLGGMMIAAATMATAAMASPAPQSRALPPETAGATTAVAAAAPETSPAVGRDARSAAKRTHQPSAAVRRDDAMVDIAHAAHDGWAVALARYGSMDAARRASASERRGWTWLRGLEAGYRSEGTGSYRIAFGPLTRAQAEGMCHEARRVQLACDAVQYGTAPA